jgi:hypothetical protein
MSEAASVLPEVLAHVKITEVWRALGGQPPKRNRAPAFWRDTCDRNVSLNDTKGAWYDFAASIGGGVLDLVQHVRGGDRRQAAAFLAELAGIQLGEMGPTDRRRWAAERERDRRDLQPARAWARAAVSMIHSLLLDLKASLFSGESQPEPGEIRGLEDWRRVLVTGGEATLLFEYRRFRESRPELAAALVRAGCRAQQAIERAARRVLAAPAAAECPAYALCDYCGAALPVKAGVFQAYFPMSGKFCSESHWRQAKGTAA